MSEYGFGGILADDMGLGKTLQVMTLIEDGIGENHVSLVVAPATLIYNWQDEIKKFSKKLKTVCITLLYLNFLVARMYYWKYCSKKEIN